MPIRIPVEQVDAFTDRPFAGNPAAVCLLTESRPDSWMRDVAREMNLSETAFLLKRDAGWSLRWFTPAVEVDLCGHATLASAHTLWSRGLCGEREPIRFDTRSGVLTARSEDGAIVLDFPADPATVQPAEPELLAALGVKGHTAFARGRFDYVVEVDDAAAVRAVAPDMGRLARVRTRGVIVTAAGEDGYDFVSRWFGPQVGVPEDPVTGSAHCCLGPWWSERLGRHDLSAAQLSPRGGSLRVRVRGDRVELIGRAVTVLSGELLA